MTDSATPALDSTLALIGSVREGLDEVEAWARAHPDLKLGTTIGFGLCVVNTRDLDEVTPSLLDGAQPGTVTATTGTPGFPDSVSRQFGQHVKVRALGPSKSGTPEPVVLNPPPVDPCGGGDLPAEAEAVAS